MKGWLKNVLLKLELGGSIRFLLRMKVGGFESFFVLFFESLCYNLAFALDFTYVPTKLYRWTSILSGDGN